MREIKFRCWDLKRNKWHTPTEWGEEPADAYIGYGTIPEIGFRSNYSYVWLQYTGLKDKNGKEIYEGDVVWIQWNFTDEYLESNKYQKPFVVEFRNYEYAPFSRYLPSPLDTEVIGNIYENPELLKESK
jgi:uncharacterized phage protein (TIGR01671 family)